MDSGVTCAELDGAALLCARRERSGVGLDGDPSADDTESDPEPMKLFISERAGASFPGSAAVKAFTAG